MAPKPPVEAKAELQWPLSPSEESQNESIMLPSSPAGTSRDESSDEDEEETSDEKEDFAVYSPGSTTPDSTSTYKFKFIGHEPFETFQIKCAALGGDVGALTWKDIKHIDGGSNNRIVPVTFSGPDGVERTEILRIPRYSEDDTWIDPSIADQAAVLELVATTGLPAPKVYAFDTTPKNALGRPFSVQTFFPGKDLEEIYTSMSLEEKLGIVDELVDVIYRLSTLRFQGFGTLGRIEFPHNKTKQRLGEVFKSEVEVRPFVAEAWNPSDIEREKIAIQLIQPMQKLFERHLESHAKLALKKGHKAEISRMRALQRIYKQYVEAGMFEGHTGTEGVACHTDLYMRNLMATREDEESPWHLSGILDWDNSYSLPPILTRKPWFWLWDPEFEDRVTYEWICESGWIEDDDPSPGYYDEEGRLSEDAKAIRERYDSRMAERFHDGDRETYREAAYGKGAWLRRLWSYAEDGISYYQRFESSLLFEDDWAEYRFTTLGIGKRPVRTRFRPNETEGT